MKLWQKKYKLNERVEEFTAGNDYLVDRKLVKYDCLASIAHAKMLAKIGILDEKESAKLVSELKKIIKLDSEGKFPIRREDEDGHTAIENYLTEKLGATGKKIHTGRSRNDQVLTALRLYCKDEISEVSGLIDEFVAALALFKKKYGKIKMPGYTHTRKAMPSSVGMWAESFVESMSDNKKLLGAVAALMDQSPLGTGAGYGVPIEVDRKMTAKLMGFAKVQNNPIYAQNSRGKFEASLLHALSQATEDLSRMSSDLILFGMPEFGYFELPPEFCTGSSIMPHKKNPDVLELVRAKHHQLVACEFEVKSITSNLISGYHRDLQLTKEPTMKGIGIAKDSIGIMALVIGKLGVNEKKCEQAMTGELYSAQKAIELAKKGKIPFRDAYKKVAGEFG